MRQKKGIALGKNGQGKKPLRDYLSVRRNDRFRTSGWKIFGHMLNTGQKGTYKSSMPAPTNHSVDHKLLIKVSTPRKRCSLCIKILPSVSKPCFIADESRCRLPCVLRWSFFATGILPALSLWTTRFLLESICWLRPRPASRQPQSSGPFQCGNIKSTSTMLYP